MAKTRQHTTNFAMEVARGSYEGLTQFIKYAHNDDVDLAAAEDLWDVGGTLTHLTSAEPMVIASTDANDKPGDTGARTVKIMGLDEDYLEIEETISLNGTTEVTTLNSFFRVNDVEVITAGSSGWNEGTINVVAQTTGNTLARVNPQESFSHSSHYTVPANKTLYINLIYYNAAKAAGGNGVVSFLFRTRKLGENAAAPWVERSKVKLDTAVQNSSPEPLVNPYKIPEKTDMKIIVMTDVDNTEVIAHINGVLIDNDVD